MTDPRFAEALLLEIRRMGMARALAPLDWRVLDVDELPVMEGAPLPGSDAQPCLAWAQSLEMEEYRFDAQDGHRSWFLLGDRWTIEISTMPHPD